MAPPADASGFLTDAYAAAWHSLSPEEEAAYASSADYRFFESRLIDGRLSLNESDLALPTRWKVSENGRFGQAARNPICVAEVSVVSVRFASVSWFLSVSSFRGELLDNGWNRPSRQQLSILSERDGSGCIGKHCEAKA
jgi:hypothetical protein